MNRITRSIVAALLTGSALVALSATTAGTAEARKAYKSTTVTSASAAPTMAPQRKCC